MLIRKRDYNVYLLKLQESYKNEKKCMIFLKNVLNCFGKR